MKKQLLISLVAVSAVYSMQANAQTSGCETKRQEILKEISFAEQHGNTQKIAGLKTALQEVDAHCTDAGVARDQQQKLDKKAENVKEKEAKLKKAQAELATAQQDGDSKKISKRQSKVREAEEDLRQAKAELAEVK